MAVYVSREYLQQLVTDSSEVLNFANKLLGTISGILVDAQRKSKAIDDIIKLLPDKPKGDEEKLKNVLLRLKAHFLEQIDANQQNSLAALEKAIRNEITKFTPIFNQLAYLTSRFTATFVGTVQDQVNKMTECVTEMEALDGKITRAVVTYKEFADQASSAFRFATSMPEKKEEKKADAEAAKELSEFSLGI